MSNTPKNTSAPTVLVVGSTGLLGGEIVKELRAKGDSVRALTRHGSDPSRTALIEQVGAERAIGDLKHPDSLLAACQGVNTVISTATAIMSRTDGDSIESVDSRGQLELVAAAERAGVRQFIFVSFLPTDLDFAFQRAKRAVEKRLQQSSMSFTIVRAAVFSEIWLNPMLGFDPMHGRARIFGEGTRPCSWISLFDVARFVVAAADGGPFANKVVDLGGPDALSYHDVLALFAAHGVRDVVKEYVPESALEAQLRGATNPRDEALTALTLSTARGQVVNSGEASRLWAGPFTRMSDYVARIVTGACSVRAAQ